MSVHIPPVSPFGLIQETLWPDEWRILVACMMLNCTTRKQVDKVLPSFFGKWPDAQSFVDAQPCDVAIRISSLGFGNRRSAALLKMTKAYLSGRWKHASDLPGIGQYASRCWEMFCKGYLGEEPPVDHALVKYWHYCKNHGYMSTKMLNGRHHG